MTDLMILFWILLFVIFLLVNLAGNSTTFGMIAGLWLLLLGLAIITTGVQIQSGMDITDTSITYTYADATYPYGAMSFIWGIILIGISMYMIIANGMKRTT